MTTMQIRFESQLVDPVHPALRCPKCDAPMTLVGIEAHPLSEHAAEIYTYECACSEVAVQTIAMARRNSGGI